MGAPIRIVDLAKDMIRLSGFTLDEIKIIITGLRPGEKLYEELLADQEKTLPTPHPKVRVAQARAVAGQWLTDLIFWLEREGPLSDDEVKRELRRWVPEYGPKSDGSGISLPPRSAEKPMPSVSHAID
jgi:FlaA1/EpsC-like NDP-sugar epimerase